jgi:hypothetical protein
VRVAAPPRHFPPIDEQRRRRLLWSGEGCLDEKSLMVNGRKQVRDIAAVPCRSADGLCACRTEAA